ncbi:anti-sigma factor family protein [Marinobacter lipolyticus]|uniref:anti-sigma factor family protein n=1 Tax=Marinobacter lipolyticus TaxID=209639 RepID=UPI003A8DFAAA
MSKDIITCEEVIERLFEYLDRELDPATQTEIDRHLRRCHDCFSRKEFERRLRDKVAASGTEKAPDRLKRRVASLLNNS